MSNNNNSNEGSDMTTCVHCQFTPCIVIKNLEDICEWVGAPLSQKRVNEFPEKMMAITKSRRHFFCVFIYCEYYGVDGDTLEKGEVQPYKIPICAQYYMTKFYPTPTK